MHSLSLSSSGNGSGWIHSLGFWSWDLLFKVFVLCIHSLGFSSWAFTPQGFRLGLLLDSLFRVSALGVHSLGFSSWAVPPLTLSVTAGLVGAKWGRWGSGGGRGRWGRWGRLGRPGKCGSGGRRGLGGVGGVSRKQDKLHLRERKFLLRQPSLLPPAAVSILQGLAWCTAVLLIANLVRGSCWDTGEREQTLLNTAGRQTTDSVRAVWVSNQAVSGCT